MKSKVHKTAVEIVHRRGLPIAWSMALRGGVREQGQIEGLQLNCGRERLSLVAWRRCRHVCHCESVRTKGTVSENLKKK